LADGIGHTEAEKKWLLKKKTLDYGCSNVV